MSTSPLTVVKVGTYWNSIWTTSGAPEPAFSAVRSFWYSAAPWPTLTSLTWMSGCVLLKRFTSSWSLGTHDQNVRLTAFDRAFPPSARLGIVAARQIPTTASAASVDLRVGRNMDR